MEQEEHLFFSLPSIPSESGDTHRVQIPTFREFQQEMSWALTLINTVYLLLP